MSKGSNFWGTARGKLGNMVISSVKGQQVERKYQPQVANPKSFAQMRQRAVFAAAVKFFKHSQQNLFQFAYEDKLQKESDYNAFMRHNVRCFAPLNKVACDNPTLPALGFNLALELSYGSLPSVSEVQWYDDSNLFAFPTGPIKAATTAKYTWGEVSQAIINYYDLSNGDIVTMVVIDTNLDVSEVKDVLINGSGASDDHTPAAWYITQRKLDLSSTEDVTKFVQGGQYFGAPASVASSGNLGFGAVIFSRNVPGRSLMVSTSRFFCNEETEYLAQIPKKDSVEEKNVLISWGANQNAILKGALL